ncbi:MAG: hypothetical protein RIR51_778 [Bacteroidota bacterium]|jgi:nucleoside transporter
MKNQIRIQLMFMMFLLFFSWGSWYGQMSKYLLNGLGASGDQVGNAYLTFSIACIIAPFIIGLIADRYFAAQKVLGFLNILSAIILYFLIQVKDPNSFFWYILAYTITFAPNLALVNSIAMRQMENPGKEFPAIRVTGTISWIIVTNIIGYLNIGGDVTIFTISMITSFILGIYAFFLPDTPPKKSENKDIQEILGLNALKLLKNPSFLIFFISSILICIPLSFYFALANPSLTASNMSNVENKMSLGQASEIIFMLLIPFAFSKYGVKKMLIIGLLAWIIRFICFGYGDGISSEWLLYLGIILHGVCYDFFFVSGQIYTDQKAGENYKSSAQGLITLATYGVGMGIGSKLSGFALDYYEIGENMYDWTKIWWFPTYIAIFVLILFILSFKEEKTSL